MKKTIWLAFAALLAATSISLADEIADKTEELGSELAQAIENMTELENPRVEAAQPRVPVASQAAVPQQKKMQKAQKFQNPQMTQTAQKTPNQQSARALTRQEIRSMDILDRPNRPGHFYGNTVRRLHGR